MKVGERIRYLRLKQGLTQKQLGELLGMDQGNLRKYESDRQAPNLKTLKKMAAALNVQPADLLPTKQWDEDSPDLDAVSMQLEAMETYLKSIGYSVTLEKVGESASGNYEEHVQDGEVVGRSWIPDEEKFNIIIRKAGVETEFTEEEFKAFRAEVEQSIEYQLWKKNQSR